jgi:2-polyprenyl-3-methyl-5-hydroxy-6-metoxy-1,4-benzoquinol methylase
VLLFHIKNPRNKKIIEVGSGSGCVSLALALKGAQCTLLDISQKSLEVATDNFIRSGLKTPEVYNENALNSTVPSSSYDVVWNAGVIEHFFDQGKERLLVEMIRMAKPAGKVIILVPNVWCLPFQLMQAILKMLGRWQLGFEDDMSPRRLRRLCERIKLRNFEAYSYNPVAGWNSIPIIARAIKFLHLNRMELHCHRSRIGKVSILVITK